VSELLSASLEDYLEAIFQIVNSKQAVRATDISKRLGVTRSSVTGALHALCEKHLVNYSPYDVITLTDKGESIARDIVRRHEVLKDFFTRVLAVEDDIADEAACKMEHAIPKKIINRFVKFVKFIDGPISNSKNISKAFARHCRGPEAKEK